MSTCFVQIFRILDRLDGPPDLVVCPELLPDVALLPDVRSERNFGSGQMDTGYNFFVKQCSLPDVLMRLQTRMLSRNLRVLQFGSQMSDRCEILTQ